MSVLIIVGRRLAFENVQHSSDVSRLHPVVEDAAVVIIDRPITIDSLCEPSADEKADSDPPFPCVAFLFSPVGRSVLRLTAHPAPNRNDVETKRSTR